MPRPVVFIHGLWLHANSWDRGSSCSPRAGYRPRARLAGRPDTVERPARTTRKRSPTTASTTSSPTTPRSSPADSPPILVGHSFGGMIAQKLLGQDLAVAAVAIDAAQIKGVLAAAALGAAGHPAGVRNPANRHRSVGLTAEQFRYAFGNAIPQEESDALHERWAIPAPGRPLFEAAAANFDPHSPAKVDTANSTAGRCC